MSENRSEPNPATPDRYSFQILQERAVRAFEFPRRRTPMRAHTALVLLNARGGRQVIYPPERPTTGELFWKRIRTVYEVDLSQHLSSIETDIPSRGDALPFHAIIDLQWRVEKPHEIVRRRIDTSQALIDAISPELLARIRRVSRQFNVIESEAAELKINAEFDAPLDVPLGADLGMWTRPHIRLSLEQSTIDYFREKLGLQRKIEIEEHADRLRQKEDDNKRDLLASRMKFYRSIISGGDVERFAAQIAHNESDLSATIKEFHSSRDADHRSLIDFFTRLTESGLIERHEMNDRIQEALDWLNKSVTRVIGIGDSLANADRERRPPGSMLTPPTLPIEATSSNQKNPHHGADGRASESIHDNGTE
ncbi:MAG TPA: hypothetical protein VJT72_23600 [Pseudonocardiaceae bacterium]|nr:hypothetical protein [Pseudonocardiaceae bacterium]